MSSCSGLLVANLYRALGQFHFRIYASQGWFEGGKDMKRTPLLFLTLLSLFAFFLIGCGAGIDREATIYSDESWEATMQIYLSYQALSLMGPMEGFEHDLEVRVANLNENGVDASWKKTEEEEGVIYAIDAEGRGWAFLSDVVFEGTAQIETIEVA